MEQDAYEIFTQAYRVYIKGIRNAIFKRLESAYGDEWWSRGVLSAIGENQRANLERALEKGVPEDMTQLIDSAHFARIVERNHAVAFANEFTNIDHTLRLFRHLSARRNEWAHVLDGQWTVPDIMQSVQAMREILISLRCREALEIHQMFQDSLDQQHQILDEALAATEDSPTAPNEIIDAHSPDYSLLRFWGALESYLVVESVVLPMEDESEGQAKVTVRVTNTAPVSEGRPYVRFTHVRLDTSPSMDALRRGISRPELGTIEPGQTVERELIYHARGLASVEFRVSCEIDHSSLFSIQRRGSLPNEVVRPLLEQLGGQFEAVGIEETLDKVVGTVNKIQPAMTLSEVASLRQELAALKPLIFEKREALGLLFSEYHISRESLLGAPLREIILLLEDLELNKISAMDSAIGETDLESIESVARDVEQLQISALRTREIIRERIGRRNPATSPVA